MNKQHPVDNKQANWKWVQFALAPWDTIYDDNKRRYNWRGRILGGNLRVRRWGSQRETRRGCSIEDDATLRLFSVSSSHNLKDWRHVSPCVCLRMQPLVHFMFSRGLFPHRVFSVCTDAVLHLLFISDASRIDIIKSVVDCVLHEKTCALQTLKPGFVLCSFRRD